jgi:hypothetical protein
LLVLISDMAGALGIGNDKNIVYADDTTVWQAGKTVAEVIDRLTEKAAMFAEWSRGSGLNVGKTQLLLTSNAGSYQLGKHGTQHGDRLGRPGDRLGPPGNRDGRPGNGGG